MMVHRLTHELVRITSVEHGKSSTNQTVVDVITDLIEQGILSQSFLSNFKKTHGRFRDDIRDSQEA